MKTIQGSSNTVNNKPEVGRREEGRERGDPGVSEGGKYLNIGYKQYKICIFQKSIQNMVDVLLKISSMST